MQEIWKSTMKIRLDADLLDSLLVTCTAIYCHIVIISRELMAMVPRIVAVRA